MDNAKLTQQVVKAAAPKLTVKTTIRAGTYRGHRVRR
jgi:hypothetical protein